MFSENEIVENALRNLEANTGIAGYWLSQDNSYDDGIDGKTKITMGETTVIFSTEVKREFREYHLDKLLRQAELNKPFMLVADKIYPAQKQRLRENGIAYLDTAGNIYISNDNLLLWLDGQKPVNLDVEKKTNRAFTKAGLKVVYAFLQNPEAVNFTYREIASYAKVALGTINEAILALKETGHILEVNKNRMILSNKKELLENWIIGYRNILKPSLLLGTYHFGGSKLWDQLELPATAIWGGEPAGDLETGHLNPEQWTIYTAQEKNELVKILKLAPRSDGNLKIYNKFWMDTTIYMNNRATPELITYADLMITGDARCIETANIIYDKKLARIFDQP
ncbi:type IV toxin-antitoxin system AbiEi family antitoxin [Dyadobacter tibetensis]|uniref:type IV toxin-antitoxin system AbiEi family antitoxin n=1 Tax=Dyadobacter tibetensis TaxID=1211851 RepID=UPI0004705014|nr:type IV toxin-antitoxin system AbiEi family antitoxin [Dyadobacter tibetensis]